MGPKKSVKIVVENYGRLNLLHFMNFTELQKNVLSLNLQDRRKLMAYLVSLEDGRNQQYKETLSRKIDNDDPNQWLSIEALNVKLGLDEN